MYKYTYLYVLFSNDAHYIYNTFSLKFQSLIQSEYPRPIKYSHATDEPYQIPSSKTNMTMDKYHVQ